MSDNKYPNSGKLSTSKHAQPGDKKPDLYGELIMTRTALKGLLEEHDGDDITIKLSGWTMQGNYGTWMRISWNNYKPNAVGNVAKSLPKVLDSDDQDIPF
jgi:hypothetical protein